MTKRIETASEAYAILLDTIDQIRAVQAGCDPHSEHRRYTITPDARLKLAKARAALDAVATEMEAPHIFWAKKPILDSTWWLKFTTRGGEVTILLHDSDPAACDEPTANYTDFRLHETGDGERTVLAATINGVSYTVKNQKHIFDYPKFDAAKANRPTKKRPAK